MGIADAGEAEVDSEIDLQGVTETAAAAIANMVTETAVAAETEDAAETEADARRRKKSLKSSSTPKWTII